MSGILGIVNFDLAPVDRELLARMTNFIAYRGPDDQQIWIDGHVGFGHTMLRNSFEAETELQPLTIDGNAWLIADARIDGRPDLLRELQTKLDREIKLPTGPNGSNSRLPNDAELILLAYKAWGEDCVKHLIGDFAFAIWNRSTQQLFCARDHFGIKPFYYAQLGSTLVFSNTLNCLRVHPGVSTALNEIAIGDYLLFGLNQDVTTTTFADIKRLPSGTKFSISAANKNLYRYWSPSENNRTVFQKPGHYVERFNEIFSQAVGDRLRTSRASVSMSGGLDSTSVAAVARDLLHEPDETALRAYVVVYDRLIPDEERHFSTLAASALNIPVTHLPADDYHLFEETLPNELQRPEPFLVNQTSAQFNELLRSMSAHSRVALSGWDGDALMSEPARCTFAADVRSLRVKEVVTNLAWFLSRRRLPPIGVRTTLKRIVGNKTEGATYPEWLEPSFSQRMKLLERWKEFQSENGRVHRTHPNGFHTLNSKLLGPLFEGYDPGVTGLALEMRHPLIDVRLVEYLLSIPVIPWCIDKEILRASMIGKLPETIRTRAKTPLPGFPALRLAEKSSVRFAEKFETTPSFTEFVSSSAQYEVTNENNPDRLWTNLRPFALNHWLTHSLPDNVSHPNGGCV